MRLPTRRTGFALRQVAAALVLLALAPAAFAQSAPVMSFGAAKVTCDEENTCVAFLTATDEDGQPRTVIQFRRVPERRARWTLSVTTLQDLADRDRPLSLAVDGGVAIVLRPGSDYAPFVTMRDFFITSQFVLDRLMVDLQNGDTMRLSYIDIAGQPHTDRFQLDGLRQALLEIDRRQNFVVGDRRAGPPVDLPPAPEVDKQSLVALEGVPPRLMEMHLSSECEAPDSASLGSVSPIIGALSDTAMLYAIPCFRTKERTNYRLYMVESGEIGGMHLLTWATWSSRFGWMGTDTLETVSYDPQTRTLTAVRQGEGAGCGTAGTWTWDQFAFKLVLFRAHEACDSPRDPADWPEVYPGPRSQ